MTAGQAQERQNYPEWEHYTNLPVGEILRRTRIYYNLSLKDVEGSLRIKMELLSALEEGRTDRLPGRAYAIGFVRAYAEYLGLDGGKMVHLFKNQSVGTANRPELHFPAPASESKIPNLYILGSSFAALVVLILLFSWISSGVGDSRSIPLAPEGQSRNMASFASQMPIEAAVLSAIEAASGAEGPQAIVRPASRIVIHAIDSAWVEIRDEEGKPLISRILKKGDSYLVPDKAGMEMDTGNAGALEILVDGQPAETLGEHGDVLRGVVLSPEKLPLRTAQE